QNTSIAFLINSAIDNFIPDPFSAEIKIPDFSDRGVYIISAPGVNDQRFNAIYTKADPLTKVRNISYNANASITSDTLKFISLSFIVKKIVSPV
ncbi:hypothetical protein JGI9_00746, partial [Candidatus Kryptonium thompsonii]